MCTTAMAVMSLRRGDELGKEGKKTKDILDVQGPHQINCGGWRDPGASQALETLEEQWNTKTKPSLLRARPKVLKAKPHPMLRALSGTSCKVRIQKQIP